MADDTYNGYTNRETRALCLWLNNDHADYEATLDRAEEALSGSGDGGAIAGRIIGEALREWFDELIADAIENPEMRSEGLLRMLFDIGSLYRVNWDEVGEHFIPYEHGR